MNQEIKATVIWLLLAFFLTFAGFWQAKVVVAQDAHPQHRLLPPPAKTKLAARPLPQAFTGDVVADYIARCEKGMTDQEIGWILEDFRNAGLDIIPPEDSSDIALIDFHRCQNRWYRDALTDGFRLSPAQSAEVDQLLAHHLQVASDIATHLATDEQREEMSELSDDDISSLFRRWYFSSAKDTVGISPANLFTPTSGQKDMLDNSFFQLVLSDPFENGPPTSQAPAKASGNSTLKGKTAATYPIWEDYPIPTGFEVADRTFPFLKSQPVILSSRTDPDNPAKFIHNVRHLHPAQLKILLLSKPEVVARIQLALESESR